jgi:transposase
MGDPMGRFVEGADRSQLTLLPECLDDWVSEDNSVHVIDTFVEALDLHRMGFEGVVAKETGRPSYHPSALLRLYIYGYLNRVQSSRRLEREAARNIEVMWLIGRLVPDHKTIADFRKDNGAAIRKVCARFVALCRNMGLLQNTVCPAILSTPHARQARSRSLAMVVVWLLANDGSPRHRIWGDLLSISTDGYTPRDIADWRFAASARTVEFSALRSSHVVA